MNDVLDLKQFEGHTPGPWEHTTRPDTGGDSRPVVTCAADLVCAVSRCDGRDDESAANARLIACAPQLLEEVRRLRKELADLKASIAESAEAERRLYEGIKRAENARQ